MSKAINRGEGEVGWVCRM